MKKVLTLLFAVSLTVSVFGQDTVRIVHTNYITTFSKSLKYPVKVEWTLTANRVNCAKKLPRPAEFKPDPQFPNTNYALDYKKSGYDKGHNCPDDDNACQTTDILEQSFYYTNVMPQPHSSNAGDWKSVETLCRSLAIKGNTVHIWSGGIGIQKKIGKDGICVPKQTWKVVYTVNTKTQ